jgi:ElaB/YqjD/DUF883 family membrane-anchored ribosome-binding protein
MAWLDRIDEREARRIGRTLRTTALDTRDLAQDHLTDFARQARRIAEPVLHQASDYARHEGAVVAKAAAQQAMRAGRAVKADPVPAIVGAVGLALLASLFIGRRRS